MCVYVCMYVMYVQYVCTVCMHARLQIGAVYV